jgi:hypothetical protein
MIDCYGERNPMLKDYAKKKQTHLRKQQSTFAAATTPA